MVYKFPFLLHNQSILISALQNKIEMLSSWALKHKIFIVNIHVHVSTLISVKTDTCMPYRLSNAFLEVFNSLLPLQNEFQLFRITFWEFLGMLLEFQGLHSLVSKCRFLLKTWWYNTVYYYNKDISDVTWSKLFSHTSCYSENTHEINVEFYLYVSILVIQNRHNLEKQRFKSCSIIQNKINKWMESKIFSVNLSLNCHAQDPWMYCVVTPQRSMINSRFILIYQYMYMYAEGN